MILACNPKIPYSKVDSTRFRVSFCQKVDQNLKQVLSFRMKQLEFHIEQKSKSPSYQCFMYSNQTFDSLQNRFHTLQPRLGEVSFI